MSGGVNDSTEERIKNAARLVFHKKGFASARTRDIADEAGINLALLNYYFRSKQKLFNIVMQETFLNFFASLSKVFNDPNSTFEEKIEKLSSEYIDLLFQEPEIPLFIMSELRNNPEELLKNIEIKHVLLNSVFFKQFNEEIILGKIKEQHFLHFIMNFIGFLVFPFMAKPLLKELGGLSDAQFNELVKERKKLIPEWIKMIFAT